MFTPSLFVNANNGTIYLKQLCDDFLLNKINGNMCKKICNSSTQITDYINGTTKHIFYLVVDGTKMLVQGTATMNDDDDESPVKATPHIFLNRVWFSVQWISYCLGT